MIETLRTIDQDELTKRQRDIPRSWRHVYHENVQIITLLARTRSRGPVDVEEQLQGRMMDLDISQTQGCIPSPRYIVTDLLYCLHDHHPPPYDRVLARC